jgi:glyoxylase-like metal-dependent hydrolase (beta-lactamase superfamily II)
MNLIARLAVAMLSLSLTGARAPEPAVKLWRLDCGALQVSDLDQYSDTRAYPGQSRRFVVSCYLVRHGDDYLLWDAGLPRPEPGARDPATTHGPPILDQLRRLGVRPEQIRLVGLSHYHFDHTGQAADFPQARLLIGKADLDALGGNARRARPLARWVGGGGAVEPVVDDKDVFGDGRVVMLDLPGHTPGHHGLLVTLARTGPVLLSGDVAHFHENLENDGVPSFNTDRSQSLASLDRFRRLGRNLRALVIVQHDERDLRKLPTFPAGAD